jgi:predicted amidohydrolase
MIVKDRMRDFIMACSLSHRVDENRRERRARCLAHDIEVLKVAREVSDATGLPIMMHWTTEPDLLNMLKAGDVLTFFRQAAPS